MSSVIDKRVTHGMRKARIYTIWRSMLNRCLNKNIPNYHRYGGRGITVCERWMNFENFYADMGNDNGLSLDRIDNNGNYEPNNCKWSTPKEQARNTRQNRMIEYNGETKSLAEWAEIKGLSYGAVLARLRAGKSTHEALTKPIYKAPKPLNDIAIKVIRYLHANGVTITRLADAYNVKRGRIKYILVGDYHV